MFRPGIFCRPALLTRGIRTRRDRLPRTGLFPA